MKPILLAPLLLLAACSQEGQLNTASPAGRQETAALASAPMAAPNAPPMQVFAETPSGERLRANDLHQAILRKDYKRAESLAVSKEERAQVSEEKRLQALYLIEDRVANEAGVTPAVHDSR